MLWFSFILGLNLISLGFKLIIIHTQTPKDKLNQQHIIHCSKETKIIPVIGSITKKVALAL